MSGWDEVVNLSPLACSLDLLKQQKEEAKVRLPDVLQ